RTSFAFTVFEEVLAITQGGPGDATWVAAWYSYRRSFAPPFDIGLGSASAYVLALVVGLLALGYVKLIYRRVEYGQKSYAPVTCRPDRITFRQGAGNRVLLVADRHRRDRLTRIGKNTTRRYQGSSAAGMDAR